jgi:hypothetical protein
MVIKLGKSLNMPCWEWAARWQSSKEITGELGTIQKKEQRMPAHQTLLLRPYPLLLLHKKKRQILVHRIWYFVKTLK